MMQSFKREGSVERYGYDTAFSRPSVYTAATGVVIRYDYDEGGRLREETDSYGSVSYGYNITEREEKFMERYKYNHKTTDVLIYVMGGIGVLFSLGGIFAGGIPGMILLFALPLFLSIMFMVQKNPIYGILYTILFVVNRSNLFFGITGNLLARIIVIIQLLFFVHVSIRSYYKWKELKKL